MVKQITFKIKTPSGKVRKVPIHGVDAQLLAESEIFANWVSRVNTDGIEIRTVTVGDNFSIRGKLLFAWLNVEAYRPNGNKIPGIIFLSGDAASVLVVIEDEETGTLYTPYTRQLRLSTGETNFAELLAGIIEDNMDSVQGAAIATALRELGEEADLLFNRDHLVLMDYVYVSAGRTPERIFFFLAKMKMKSKQINAMKQKITGLRVEGEEIELGVCLLSQLQHVCRHDAKALSALKLFEDYRQSSVHQN